MKKLWNKLFKAKPSEIKQPEPETISEEELFLASLSEASKARPRPPSTPSRTAVRIPEQSKEEIKLYFIEAAVRYEFAHFQHRNDEYRNIKRHEAKDALERIDEGKAGLTKTTHELFRAERQKFIAKLIDEKIKRQIQQTYRKIYTLKTLIINQEIITSFAKYNKHPKMKEYLKEGWINVKGKEGMITLCNHIGIAAEQFEKLITDIETNFISYDMLENFSLTRYEEALEKLAQAKKEADDALLESRRKK